MKHADVVSGDDGMTVMELLLGESDAGVEPPVMAFQNQNRSYPIRGVPDNVPGGSCPRGPKSWTDRAVMTQYMK